MTQNKYYIYLHIKLDTGEPFYVGKGTGNRANSKMNRSKWWKNTVTKHNYDVIMLEEGLIEEEALIREIYWIKRIGRKDIGLGPLVNMTDGGEGISGFKFSEESKEKMSLKQKGCKRPSSIENCRQMGLNLKGKKKKPFTQEHINNMSKSHSGEKNHMFGKKHSKETIAKNVETRRVNKINKLKIENNATES